MILNRTACFAIRNLPIKKTEIPKNIATTQKKVKGTVKMYTIKNHLVFQKILPRDET